MAPSVQSAVVQLEQHVAQLRQQVIGNVLDHNYG